MKTSKTYIIAWDKAIDNCIDISNQLVSGNLEHTFYNVSSINNQTKHWQTAEDVRYYNHFFNAIKDFLSTEHDIFIFNSGDIHYNRYSDYTKWIEQLFVDNPNLAVFAPNSTKDIHSGWGSLIDNSKKYSKLYLSTNTDGLWTSMSREIAEYMYEFQDWANKTKQIDFSKMISGWGLDYIYCSLAIYLNKIVYRDSSVTVFHPTGQSYGEEIAVREFREVIRSFLIFAQDAKGFNSERIRDIVNKTIGKVKEGIREPLGREAVYSDVEAVRDA